MSRRSHVSSRRAVVWSWILSLLVWILLMGLYFHRFSVYLWLGTEDKPGENLTALFYAVAAVAMFVASRRFTAAGRRPRWHGLWYVLLGLFFFFVAGEEISWGQRWLGITPPETIRSHNVQGEMNLHNLSIFDKDSALLNQQTVLKGFVLVYGLLLPLAVARWRGVRDLARRSAMPVMPGVAAGWFVVALLQWQIFAKLYPHWVHSEICELLIATGFFLGAMSLAHRLGRSPEPRSA